MIRALVLLLFSTAVFITRGHPLTTWTVEGGGVKTNNNFVMLALPYLVKKDHEYLTKLFMDGPQPNFFQAKRGEHWN